MAYVLQYILCIYRPPTFKIRIRTMLQVRFPKVILIHGGFRWLKIGFSDLRASFQLVCFTFIRMGRSGGNNGFLGSLKGRWFEENHLPFYKDEFTKYKKVRRLFDAPISGFFIILKSAFPKAPQKQSKTF